MINPEPGQLLQAQQGNTEAFSQLVEMYQRPIFNLCHRMLGDPHEAEDAAQETFLRAYNSIKRYDNQRSFSTWLLSIAAHYCIDQIRKRRTTILSIDASPEFDVPDPGPGPEAALRMSEEQKQVRALLNILHPKDRAAVVMLYWYDLSYDEIAEALSLTVSAVKSRLHRARLQMARRWSDPNSPALITERRRRGQAQSPAF